MAGRRANELKLNLHAVTVKSFSGKKVVSTATLPAEVVKGVAGARRAPTKCSRCSPTSPNRDAILTRTSKSRAEMRSWRTPA